MHSQTSCRFSQSKMFEFADLADFNDHKRKPFWPSEDDLADLDPEPEHKTTASHSPFFTPTSPIPIRSNMRHVLSCSSIVSDTSNGFGTLRSDGLSGLSCGLSDTLSLISGPPSPDCESGSQLAALFCSKTDDDVVCLLASERKQHQHNSLSKRPLKCFSVAEVSNRATWFSVVFG